MIAAAVDADLESAPAFGRALGYLTREPIAEFGCCVARNRSAAASRAMQETDADVLISVDPDVDYDETHLAALAARVRETNGIAGGLYSHAETMYNFAPSGAHTLLDGESRTEFFQIGPRSPQGPTRVDAIGTGCLAAHRSVYERILTVHPELILAQHEDIAAHWYYERMIDAVGGMHCLSEDYSFCSYARDAGCAVEIMPGIVLGHRGEPWWQPLGCEPECGHKTLKITSQGFCKPRVN